MKNGWTHERRWFGRGECFSAFRNLLVFGKWGVTGSTGNGFHVIGPDGWQRDKQFELESDAMDFIEKQKEPNENR